MLKVSHIMLGMHIKHHLLQMYYRKHVFQYYRGSVRIVRIELSQLQQ